MNARTARRAAAALFLSRLGFVLLIQVESVLRFVRPAAGTRAAALLLAALPFGQREHLAVAALAPALFLLCGRRRPVAWAGAALVAALNLYAALDQMVYGAFLSHLGRSMLSDLPPDGDLLRSFLYEATPWFWLNLAALGAAFAATARALTAPPLPDGPAPGPTRGALLALGVLLAANAAAPALLDYRGLDADPVRAFDDSAPSAWKAAAPAPEPTLEAADAPAPAPLARPALRRPNIVLVVLESVGAEQILVDGGNLSKELTPDLASRADSTIVFPDFYARFPATTFAHAALMTGGWSPTWGSEAGELFPPFQGPSLPRELARAGYRAGLFSAQDLDEGNMDRFERGLGFDRLEDFRDIPGAEAARVSPWGLDERVVLGRAESWIDAGPRGRPFFLELLTAGTHYPYSAPKDHPGAGVGDRRERYRNALRFADAVLSDLGAALKARGLDRNTIVLVTGDHGEAFGTPHAWNWLHRTRLYEENIRSFLLVLAPGARARRVGDRLASSGDLMPTVLALAGAKSPPTLGQDLFAPDFRPRVVHFFKSVAPEQWGLRDGRWKFVGAIAPDGAPATAELYDLEKDPDELVNLAASESARVAAYRRSCADWYFGMRRAFDARRDGAELRPARESGIIDPHHMAR